MAEIENLKVAVRVRPFNNREIGRKAKMIIEMNGQSTAIKHPNDPKDAKKFTFDHSYWSFDGFKDESNGYSAADPSHPNGKKFADQVCSSFCLLQNFLSFSLFFFLSSFLSFFHSVINSCFSSFCQLHILFSFFLRLFVSFSFFFLLSSCAFYFVFVF